MNQPGRDLYLLAQDRLQGVLFPDSDGAATVVATTALIVRGAYASVGQVETSVTSSPTRFDDKAGLLVGLASPDGPPYRSCLYYTYQGPITAPWRDGSKIYQGGALIRYEVTTTQGHWQWLSDYSVGQPGYF